MTGIPDPGGVSGTFAALERTSPIVQVAEGVATTTSMRVANGTRNEHRAVLQLIGDNMADFEEFGRVASEMQPFDTAGGVQHRRVYILNEEHATLLLTYMRNNEVVKDFKKRLVREFHLMRAELAAPLSDDEIVHQALAITARRVEVLTAKVAELEPSATAWDRLHELGADYEVADAAKILSRDESIDIGRNRLFEFMHDQDWIFRGRHNAWKAYQDQVDCGRLIHRPGGEYFHKPTGEYRTGDPTILVTAKGLAELRRLLGGRTELSLVVSS